MASFSCSQPVVRTLQPLTVSPALREYLHVSAIVLGEPDRGGLWCVVHAAEFLTHLARFDLLEQMNGHGMKELTCRGTARVEWNGRVARAFADAATDAVLIHGAPARGKIPVSFFFAFMPQQLARITPGSDEKGAAVWSVEREVFSTPLGGTFHPLVYGGAPAAVLMYIFTQVGVCNLEMLHFATMERRIAKLALDGAHTNMLCGTAVDGCILVRTRLPDSDGETVLREVQLPDPSLLHPVPENEQSIEVMDSSPDVPLLACGQGGQFWPPIVLPDSTVLPAAEVFCVAHCGMDLYAVATQQRLVIVRRERVRGETLDTPARLTLRAIWTVPSPLPGPPPQDAEEDFDGFRWFPPAPTAPDAIQSLTWLHAGRLLVRWQEGASSLKMSTILPVPARRVWSRDTHTRGLCGRAKNEDAAAEGLPHAFSEAVRALLLLREGNLRSGPGGPEVCWAAVPIELLELIIAALWDAFDAEIAL